VQCQGQGPGPGGLEAGGWVQVVQVQDFVVSCSGSGSGDNLVGFASKLLDYAGCVCVFASEPSCPRPVRRRTSGICSVTESNPLAPTNESDAARYYETIRHLVPQYFLISGSQ
jgi:hypothetical protein